MSCYRRQLEGCWLGKNVGGILGTPFEGFPTVNEIEYYTPVPERALPNDDVELQVMYAAALDRLPRVEINREVLADIWRKHFSFHCDEYAVALRNLALGIRPPWSGSFDNAFTAGMGAAIRSELWACLAPGNPALAARFAREDACIDHAGEGIDAEVFLAALESGAFVGTDLEKLIREAMTFLPSDSLLKTAIRDLLTHHRNGGNWLSARNLIFDRYATEFKTDVRSNVPFTVLALLYGGGDFGKTICTAVNCGMDTDCSAATAGAVMGILNPDGISESWLKPVGRELVVRPTAVHDLPAPGDIDSLCAMIERLRSRLVPEVKDVPSPEPDYEPFRRNVEYAMFENLHWYHIDRTALSWHPFRMNPVGGSLSVPEHNGNLQVLLRIPFEIPSDGAYSVMFNSITSNQCYLDPDGMILHDSKNMTFGRQRLWLDEPDRCGRYPASMRPMIYAPCLGGAPLNQIRRNIPLKRGEHVLYAALEPFPSERVISWGFGVGPTADNRFVLPGNPV